MVLMRGRYRDIEAVGPLEERFVGLESPMRSTMMRAEGSTGPADGPITQCQDAIHIHHKRRLCRPCVQASCAPHVACAGRQLAKAVAASAIYITQPLLAHFIWLTCPCEPMDRSSKHSALTLAVAYTV